MQIIEHKTEFHISFEYGEGFNRNYAAMKELPEARWYPPNKVWRVPISAKTAVYQLAHTHQAQFFLANEIRPEQTGDVAPLPDLKNPLPLNVVLRPYQGQGIARSMELRRLIIGDEQGLGKTLQSIGTIVGIEYAMQQASFPCLVICPASTKLNWQREWHKFSSKKAMVMDDKTKNTWHHYWRTGQIDVFITNYESLKKFFVASMPVKGNKAASPLHSRNIVMKDTIDLFKSVIVDESQRCKDSTTERSKLVLRICSKKENVLLLSGTPVVNRPGDLFPQLAIMGHANTFGGEKAYLQRYCEGGKGANNLKELNYLLNKHCFFRREKKDVAKDLPEKQRQTIICEISNRDEYQRAEKDVLSYLEQNGSSLEDIKNFTKAEDIQKMMMLKQIAAKGKLNAVKEFVTEIMEAGEKLILFCSLHSIVDQLLEMFPKAVTVTGRDDMQARQRSIDSFQQDPKCQLIICNIKAAGVGITLTASSRVAFVEYPWTYADCVQCEDRAHRIGQTNNVMCTYFLGAGTVDERLFEIILEKMHIGNTITGATDQMEMETVDKTINLFN